MKERFLHRGPARRRGGFTLAETLVAVAVLVVLMGLAVPAFAQLQRSLSVAELDEKAEQIYNAAQFQLSSLKTAGRLAALDALDANEASPSDYSGSTGAGDIRYAVKGNDVVRELIMPEGTTLATQGATPGSYVVELSPASGEVYAVYYWEDGATDASGAVFAGDDAAAAEAFYLSVRSHREAGAGTFLGDHHIGYYNGGTVSEVEKGPGGSGPGTGSSTPFNPGELRPEPVDGERLEVPVDYGAGDLGGTDFDLSKLRLSIFVQQIEDDGYLNPAHRAMVRVNGGAGNAPTKVADWDVIGEGQYIDVSPQDLDVGTGVPTYILDSLECDGSGLPMSIERRTNGLIDRGRNIRITVYVEYEGSQLVYGPYMKNTIFGSYDEGTRTVEVGNIRHLVNLSQAGALFNQVQAISLTSDIVFEPGREAIDPIDLGGITVQNKDFRILGNNCTIEGAVIGNRDNPTDNAGLFSRLNVSIQDLTLKDATVYGRNNVGALFGYQENSGVSIENCRVMGGTVTGESNVGGLVGSSVGGKPYSNCSSTASVVATGAGPAGGFVGAAQESTFTNCTAGSASAAVSVAGTGASCSCVGGFAGKLVPSGARLSGCQAYADVSGRDYVGGFVGRTDPSAWSYLVNCQASASYGADGKPTFRSVSGRDYVGGFAGSVVDMNELSGCLAQADVSGTGDYVGGFVGSLASVSAVEDCTVPGIGDRYPTYRGSGSHVGAFAGSNSTSLTDCWSKAVSVG